jgi:hypothetical protein
MKKTTFRTKWGAGILMLLTAFIASQMVYRSSIIRLHDQLLSAAAIAEQMHASEKFHSALHLMLMAATRYAETGNESLRTDFVRELDVARSALPVLGTRHGSNASVAWCHPHPGERTDRGWHMRKNFSTAPFFISIPICICGTERT